MFVGQGHLAQRKKIVWGAVKVHTQCAELPKIDLNCLAFQHFINRVGVDANPKQIGIGMQNVTQGKNGFKVQNNAAGVGCYFAPF